MARYEKYETIPPYEISESLALRIKELGMEENLRQMQEVGYTVLEDAALIDLTDRLREAIVRLAQETEGPRKGYAAALLCLPDATAPLLSDIARSVLLFAGRCGVLTASGLA